MCKKCYDNYKANHKRYVAENAGKPSMYSEDDIKSAFEHFCKLMNHK